MILLAVAVLVGVFLAATGRGGEMSYEPADHTPLDLGPVSPADIALLRPPTALWGYNVQVTNEALEVMARAMRERDITIAYLQQQVADLAPPPALASPSAVAPQSAGAPQSAAASEAPLPPAPQHARPEDRYEPASPAGQESRAGQEPPAAGEQDR
jgi:hypothetical protein